MLPWPIEPPIQSPCKAAAKGKYTMSVCRLLAQAWVHIYLSPMRFARKAFYVLHSRIKVKMKGISHMLFRARKKKKLEQIGEIMIEKKIDNITISLCAQEALNENTSAYIFFSGGGGAAE